MQTLMESAVGKRPDRRTKPRAGADRRAEPRLAVDEDATLHLLRPSVGDRIAVRIMDISQSGVGFRSPQSIPIGTLVHIRIRGTIVAIGQVRYSASVEGEYYAGILVEHAADCRSSWESA